MQNGFMSYHSEMAWKMTMLDNPTKPETERYSPHGDDAIPLELHFRIAKQKRRLALLRYKLGVRNEIDLPRRIEDEKELPFHQT